MSTDGAEGADPTPPVVLSPPGPRIRRRREFLGLTQAELAARTKGAMSTADIDRLESNQIVFPSWVRLLLLADALDCTPQDLTEAT